MHVIWRPTICKRLLAQVVEKNMIKFLTGDILKSEAECLVNTVNCEGYMGKGIAYQFKLAYPENNKDYVKACKDGSLEVGKLHYFRENGKLVINFPTKNKWREKSEMSYVVDGMRELKKLIYELRIGSIAIPPLGCGNGGLNWHEVREIILNELEDSVDDLNIYIYEPSTYYKSEVKEAPKLNVSHMVIMRFKPFLKSFNSLSIQKSAFFMTILAGEEYFKFKKYKFGPYSHTIDVLIKNIKEFQNHYKVDTSIAYEMANKTLVSKNVESKLEHYMPYIMQSVELVNSIKSDRQLELIATVCFIIKEKSIAGLEDVIKGIQDWSEDKANRFSSEDEIKDAIDFLLDNHIILQNLEGKFGLCKKVQPVKAKAM